MRWWRTVRLWLAENWFWKKTRRLQQLQLEEHRSLVDEVKKRKRASLHDQAELVWRLDMVTEQLERAIRDMEREQDG